MAHQKNSLGFPIEHNQIGSVDEMNAASAESLNAGVSNTDMSTINAGVLNTLPAYQQALAIADQVYQEREPISPAMLSFLFFSKM
ncbi:hypothetical protein OAA24_00580, partial [bacterium]|nr:hypothetical protein [bacterium]